MDFWAQHKDFVLKVLAGLGVFLVALIARGIVYGDDLETALSQNARDAAEIRRMKLLPQGTIDQVQQRAQKLRANAEDLGRQIAWDLSDEGLSLKLIESSLSRLRSYAGPERAAARAEEARLIHEAIQRDLNGGFGVLRQKVTGELVDEAAEWNIRMDEGVGFNAVTEIEASELTKYLLQLELCARIARYAIDARAEAIDSVKIADREVEAAPNLNPAFYVEHPVDVTLRGSMQMIASVLNRLAEEPPGAPVREIKIRQPDRKQPDRLIAELTVLAAVCDPKAPFRAANKE